MGIGMGLLRLRKLIFRLWINKSTTYLFQTIDVIEVLRSFVGALTYGMLPVLERVVG